MPVAERPRPYTEELRQISEDALKHKHKLPITHGWYMRGSGSVYKDEWQPEPGLPSDVLVYLDMGDTYVREMYPEKGFFPLSVVRNKKAIANLSDAFAIEPPDMDTLAAVMEKLRRRRPEAINAIETEIEEAEQKLKDGGLPAGEPSQYRRKIRLLKKRIEMVKDDARFETFPLYEQMVRERQAVLESQQDPGAVRLRAMEQEREKWSQHLETERAARDRAGTASTSSPASDGKSTRRPTASGDD
jgi:hypothetical protein